MLLRALCLLLCLAPAALRAQGALPHFDCAALIHATGLGDSSARTRQRLNAAPLTLTWLATEGLTPPDKRAPVTMVPLRNGITPRLARSAPVSIGTEVMVCTLIGMSVRPYLTAETPYMVADLRAGPRPAELPLLLIGRYPDARAADLAFAQWIEQSFPIPVQFDAPLVRPVTTPARGALYTLLADHRVFAPLPLLGDTDWTEANVLAINPGRAPEDSQAFLNTAGLGDSQLILALCGSRECADFRAARPQPPSAPSPEPTATPAEPAIPAQPEPTLDPRPLPEALVRPTAPAAAALPDPAPAPIPGPNLHLSYLGPDGQDQLLPDSLTNQLDCLLASIGAEIFLDPPECSDPAFAAFRDSRALIRRLGPNRWQVVPGARDLPPRAVLVTLPRGQSAEGCAMDLLYDGPDGTVRLALNPISGTEPARFTAIPIAPIPVIHGTARMRLAVNSPEACGGPGREVALPSDRILTLPLVADGQPSHAIVHLVASHAGELDALGLDPAGRLDLARQLIGAIEATQARLAAEWQGEAWPLTGVQFSRLDNNAQLVPLVTLTAGMLRQGAAERFATLPETTASDLANQRPGVTAESLIAQLSTTVIEAGRQGISHLNLTLIAPATPPDALANPCADPRFARLARDLIRPDGPEVSLTILPIARLEPDDRPDLSAFAPLILDPQAPSRPGGLTRCLAPPPGTSIYPFFVEPWRPAGTIPGRYSAALSDRLARDLSDRLGPAASTR